MDSRTAFIHPLHFGKREARALPSPIPAHAFSDDVKLFATTFAAGFLFVSLYLI